MGRVSFVQTVQRGALFQFFLRSLRDYESVTTTGKSGIKSFPGRFSVMSVKGQGKGWDVLDSEERARFEQLVLPHLDAAFNLSRWLLRSRTDAEDVAQE